MNELDWWSYLSIAAGLFIVYVMLKTFSDKE